MGRLWKSRGMEWSVDEEVYTLNRLRGASRHAQA